MRRAAIGVLAILGAVAGCGSPTAPAFPVDAPPSAFTLRVGGWGFGSHDVALRGDTLVVTRRLESTPGDSTTARVVPTRAQWGAFWRAADAAGVREWPSRCANTSIVDGGGFSLELAYDGGRVTAQGSNSYPQRGGRCSGDPAQSPEYRAFLGAVSQLIGRSYP